MFKSRFHLSMIPVRHVFDLCSSVLRPGFKILGLTPFERRHHERQHTRGLASIIDPCWNQLEFTQQCLRALRCHTRDPWELIVIDKVDHIRLFPLRDDVRSTYRVHEQILPALKQILQALNRADVSVRWTDLPVRHTGYANRALRDRKLERDFQILKCELAARLNDPFVLFNLGANAVERRQWHEVLEFLERSVAGETPTDSSVLDFQVPGAFHRLGRI